MAFMKVRGDLMNTKSYSLELFFLQIPDMKYSHLNAEAPKEKMAVYWEHVKCN